MTTSAIIILGGAGLGSWVWDDLRAALPDVDTRVVTYPKGPSVRLRDAAESVVTALDQPSVVVAHSLGGVVAAAAASLAPDRMTGLLAVSAVVPASGSSFVRSMPMPARLVLPVLLRLAGTRPPEKAIRQGLALGLATDVADRVVDEFDPESRGLYLDTVGTPRWPARRGYVTTTEDKELPAAAQAGFAARLGGDWQRSLATGHLPMLQDPAALAAAVRDFVAAPTRDFVAAPDA